MRACSLPREPTPKTATRTFEVITARVCQRDDATESRNEQMRSLFVVPPLGGDSRSPRNRLKAELQTEESDRGRSSEWRVRSIFPIRRKFFFLNFDRGLIKRSEE